MNTLKKIGIIYKPNITGILTVCEKVEKFFYSQQIVTIVSEITNPTKDIDFAIIIGGDGTILKAARFYAPLNIPIFGINVGRLGFLAQAQATNIEDALKKIIDQNYKIDNRLMLNLKNNNINALNDIVVKNANPSKTIELMVYLSGNHICNYLADGLIIATPTGSTAYTLSAGGPVLEPSLEAIVLVPICPHTLSARPLVIPSNETVEICPKNSDNEFSVYIDGQIELKNQKNVIINKSEDKAKITLINNDNNSFYTILKEKLNWGTDPRA